MKRHWVFAIAALVALPRLGQAQGDVGWGPTVRVTPFVGISPGIKQRGTATTLDSNGNVAFNEYWLEYSSSVPLGISVDFRAWNRFGIIASGLWASRGEGKLTDFENEVVWRTEGVDFWMAKAALAMRLRESAGDMQLRRLNATLFIGPAIIHDAPKVSPTTPVLARDKINHWGVNFGADAEMPMANPRLAFQLGLENFMTFWDEDSYANRVQPYFPAATATTLELKKTNMWILRGGLSFRF